MPDLNVGGQAVIEGVMMRSKDKVATAVRIPNGEILIKTEPYVSFVKKHKLLNIPIIRGTIVFVEMLLIGIKTLNFSAEVAVEEAEKEEAHRNGQEHVPREKKGNTWYLIATAIVALGAGVLLFFFLPLAVSDLLNIGRDAVAFNLIAGAIRVTLFVAYVWGISCFREMRRVFEYHGAEHKSIYTYESGGDLTPERAVDFTRLHPRCGTSFIIIVALLAIFIYAISDSVFASLTGHAPTLLVRFGIHFSLLPLVAGTSYELLKLSGKTRDNAITRALIQPGLWLQRITTKEPSLDQLEVAIAALEAAEGLTDSKLTSRRTAVY